VLAGLEVGVGLLVFDVFGDADLDPADGRRHGHHTAELHLGRVGDLEPGELLHREHGAGESAVGERGVDLLPAHRVVGAAVGVRAAGDGHVHVAGKADHGGVGVVLRDVQQHRHVVEVAGGVLTAEHLVLALAAVAADHEEVDAAFDRAELRCRFALDLVLEVHAGLDAGDDVVCRDRGDGCAADHEHGESGREELHHGGRRVRLLESAVAGDRAEFRPR
jgi:hypothetical protein